MRAEDHGIESWDSSLVSYLLKVSDLCAARKLEFDTGDLPAGVPRLLALARAVPVKADAARGDGADSLPVRIGRSVLEGWRGADQAIGFLGEIVLGLGRMMVGRARFRGVDFLQALQDAGAASLPIVTIVSLLIGLTVAFVGAIQLRQFGAEIYVANLVGLAMTREMAALMTAIILAGRTGAAFAAQLGTMQGNEEIDALSTIGISPIEFLVLPRVLALALMMPLLCVYACFLGIFGGYLVGTSMLGLSGSGLHQRDRERRPPDRLLGRLQQERGVRHPGGLCRGACAACRRAAARRRSGWRRPPPWSTAIVLIIVVDAIFAVMTNLLGI